MNDLKINMKKPDYQYRQPTPRGDDEVNSVAAREYRKSRRVRAREVAALLRMTPSNLSLYETGQRTWTVEFFTRYLAGVDAVITKPEFSTVGASPE